MTLSATDSPPTADHVTVWMNGLLCDDPARAVVPANDHGLVVGDGVFEALKVTSAGAFAVRRHLVRLSRSAAALGLPAPEHATVRAAIDTVLAAANLERGRLRITYTGGRGPLGSGAAYGPPTLIVAADTIEAPAPSTAVVTAPWSRNERGALTNVKSTSYADNVRALAFATARNAGEAIFLNTAGEVCEGTGTNLFLVKDGTLLTPPMSAGPLAGITRELILEWCDVVEKTFTLQDALGAGEAFLTSSLRDVQGIQRWDDQDLPTSHPITDRVAAIFAERSADELDP